MGLRVIVAGGRDFYDREYLEKSLDEVLKDLPDVEIVSGHAKGADTLAENYAKKNHLPLKMFPADWTLYRGAAGPIRNRKMLSYILEENPMVVAFWDGKSRGTKNMIEEARMKGVPCKIFMYPEKN